MAYEKQTKRIVTGGLNTLLPGDQIGDDEAQELLNFSVDSFGTLISRKGHTLRHSVGAKVLKMIRGLGALWVAAGGSVFKDGVATIGGVSSTRIGLASWRDFLWAMSETDQRKSDGTNDWDWIPEAPTTAATAAAAAEVITTVDDLTSGFTVDPAGDESYDPTLKIVATEENVYSAEKDISLDLGTDHSLDDVHRIRVWFKKSKRINDIIFEVDVNDGTFTKDYYTARMSRKNIKGARKETLTFYLRKRPQEVDQAVKDKKAYGWFERVGATPDKDWRTCVAIRIKVDFRNASEVRIEEWVVVGDALNTLEGDDFQVFYTYTTEAAHESNPSPASEAITVNRSGIDVSGMVPSPDPQVTGQNVYVTGGTLAHVYRANGNTPIVGTTYQVRATFDDLTNDNLQLEDTHNNPPVVGGLIGQYFGRLIAFGGVKAYWSHINKPFAFAGPELLDGDWVAVEEGIGELLAATMRPGVLWLYGTNGVAILQGDPGGFPTLHRAAVQMGIQSQNGVVQTPRGDFASMSEGAYIFTGDSAQLLSKKIDPAFKGTFNPANAAVGFRNEIYWISDGAVTFKYDAMTDRWFQDSRVFSCFYSDGTVLLGGTPTGQVLELESGVTDNGGAFPVAFKSKAYDLGILDNEKTWSDYTGWADTGGQNLTVTAFLNDGCDDAFTVVLGVLNSTSEERFVLQFTDEEGVQARNCAIRITGTISGEVRLGEMALNYYVEARHAKSFDTDERDDGTKKVKEVLEIYVDLETPSPAQLIIKSDQPGFEMATRDSAHAFGSSTTRRGDMYVLPLSVLGHNYRVLMDGVDFQLYGMRVLAQIIGTLLHGSKGEFYRSDPIGMGTELVKLFKEVHVKYASNAPAIVTMRTELPDGSLQSVIVTPSVLPSTSGIRFGNLQTAKLRLPTDAKGRLVEISIHPTGDFRLEELQIFAKLVGAPNATAWNWYPFPVQATQPAIWQEIPVPPDAVG